MIVTTLLPTKEEACKCVYIDKILKITNLLLTKLKAVME